MSARPCRARVAAGHGSSQDDRVLQTPKFDLPTFTLFTYPPFPNLSENIDANASCRNCFAPFSLTPSSRGFRRGWQKSPAPPEMRVHCTNRPAYPGNLFQPSEFQGTSRYSPLAEQVGIPHWALKKRARELGLGRAKEKPWSEPELAILARYAWMSDERIRLKLKTAGYAVA